MSRTPKTWLSKREDVQAAFGKSRQSIVQDFINRSKEAAQQVNEAYPNASLAEKQELLKDFSKANAQQAQEENEENEASQAQRNAMKTTFNYKRDLGGKTYGIVKNPAAFIDAVGSLTGIPLPSS
jgi:hypothetical protein